MSNVGMTVTMLLGVACAYAAGAWSGAVEVRHDDNLCVSYQARVDGPYLVVRATVEPGWHTFAMDNKVRAMEKLAGKSSLGIDHPTEIIVSGGLEANGPWYQTAPKDMSKPDLRWYSWGFEKQAIFAVKIRPKGAAPANIAIRGQACTETTCKNIDAAMTLPAVRSGTRADPSDINLKDLVQVR
jgi:hypothetical protein